MSRGPNPYRRTGTGPETCPHRWYERLNGRRVNHWCKYPVGHDGPCQCPCGRPAPVPWPPANGPKVPGVPSDASH
jgi:hypothetical protein